jgi:hypothetical protein
MSTHVPPPLTDHFRLLGLAVRLHADPPALLEPLQHVVVRAADDLPVKRAVNVRVVPAGNGLQVDMGEGRPRRLCCTDVALAHIHIVLTRYARDLHAGDTTLHCGAATLDGRLALFTGDRGAGKTTLLARLLLAGADFHCDEYVLTRDGLAITFPRPLHVKPGTLAHLPEVAAVCRRKPLLQHWNGVKYYPVDPEDLGHAWHSVRARPAAILHLEPGFDGPPHIEPIAQIEMVKRLMCQTLDQAPDIRRQARDVCALVRGTPCFALRVGALEETLDLVRHTLSTLEPV